MSLHQTNLECLNEFSTLNNRNLRIISKIVRLFFSCNLSDQENEDLLALEHEVEVSHFH